MESWLEQLEKKPDDFDWVSARANCSAAVIFEKLKKLAIKDIQTMNSLRARDSLLFRLEDVDGDSSMVIGFNQLNRKRQTVTCALIDDGITIEGPTESRKIKATITFCNDGICRAKVADKELDLWQLRKLALEDLFFNQ
jgi:hypothetical protein